MNNEYIDFENHLFYRRFLVLFKEFKETFSDDLDRDVNTFPDCNLLDSLERWLEIYDVAYQNFTGQLTESDKNYNEEYCRMSDTYGEGVIYPTKRKIEYIKELIEKEKKSPSQQRFISNWDEKFNNHSDGSNKLNTEAVINPDINKGGDAILENNEDLNFRENNVGIGKEIMIKKGGIEYLIENLKPKFDSNDQPLFEKLISGERINCKIQFKGKVVEFSRFFSPMLREGTITSPKLDTINWIVRYFYWTEKNKPKEFNAKTLLKHFDTQSL